jgi:RimJ/RimL family protein N-acetyltransferase
MAYLLETERLTLREFTLEDADFIVELVNTPGWLQFIGDRNIHTTQQAVFYLENGPLKGYQEHGFGLSMVETKAEGTPIGMCGIMKRDSLEHPDIGFAFLPAFHHQGYAYEIAREVLSYTKSHLRFPTVSAIVDPENIRSIQLLQKLGMHTERKTNASEGEEGLLLFVTKPETENSTGL